jgi:hypothetical protein
MVEEFSISIRIDACERYAETVLVLLLVQH